MAFTVRAGGHSISGRSIRDGALCIDLRGLDAVHVDPGTALVRVGGGALLGDLDRATAPHGLAVPAGHISHTGVGGLTLGGGVGWLMRAHGLTIDSLVAAEVVLADGRIVRASAEEHIDLFWALRGGGGDFGVVTEFTFRGRRIGPLLYAGMLIHPWAQAREALRRAQELMAGAPDELTMFVTLMTAPPAPPFPADLQGRPAVAIGFAWAGAIADGERTLAPLRAAFPPALDLAGPMPYTALQTMLDQTAPPGWHFSDRMHYVGEVEDDLIDALVAGYERAPGPFSCINVGWMGGAVRAADAGATAFGHRDAGALVWLIGCSGLEPVDAVADWIRALWEETAAHATGGVYVNALHEGRSIREAYADDTWTRLVAVKRRYDPDAVFSGNGVR
jgi:FAD/FMN-containing dehydrogenase